MPNLVYTLEKEDFAVLRAILEEQCFHLEEAPYMYFKASKEKNSICAYLSGKLVIQGKGADEIREFILEPLVLKERAFTPQEAEEPFQAHAGMDESGKGDFFGPLVVAGVYVNEETGSQLAAAGVCDSKLIKSDKKITELAQKIRDITAGNFALVQIGPEAYNRLYGSFGNLNRLLAWGHAKVIEELLVKVPDCPRMLSDKFGNESLIRNALQTRGRLIQLDQQTKAESDVAVAAASILARDGFIRLMAKLSETAGVTLPRGAGANVQSMANELAKRDPELLQKISKTHFRTWYRAMNLPEPEKTFWQGR